MSCRRGWARLGEQFRPQVRTQLSLFLIWVKTEKKNLQQAHPELQKHELERAKKRMNSVLGENLGGLHQRRNQRSAPQSAQKCVPQKKAALLNSVREENLEDQRFALHDEELECRRSAPESAAIRKNRIRSSARPPAVPPAAARELPFARRRPQARSWALR